MAPIIEGHSKRIEGHSKRIEGHSKRIEGNSVVANVPVVMKKLKQY
jgi:hypothetical protein